MNKMALSHIGLRKILGWLGLALPVLCVIGGWLAGQSGNSISAYYGTNMRDLFVGVLFLTGFFMITYKGYDKKDDIITTIGGVASIVTAFFPCCSSELSIWMLPDSISSLFHLVGAITLFASFGFMSYFQFTKTDGNMTDQKKKRNVIYRTCGIVIAAMILYTPLGAFWIDHTYGLSTILVVETIMLVAFAISWFTKGEALLKDK